MREPEILTCHICHKPYPKDNGWPLSTCPLCRVNDVEYQSQIVRRARFRPADKWVTRDLTLEQWLKTLLYFEAKCAYCQFLSYECLEHFIPMKLGGSTSISNCVPSCLRCNKLKDNLHPALVTKIPHHDIERVRSYLQQF